MAGNKLGNQALAAVLLLSMLAACSVQGRTHYLTGSCDTPDSCKDSQSTLEGILESCLSDAQGSTVPVKDDSCCTGIMSLDPSCLCKALELVLGYKSLLNINTTATLAIPDECGYNVPANCVCDGYPVPSASSSLGLLY